MSTLKETIANRLRAKFSTEDVVDSIESLLRGESVRKKYKVVQDKKGNDRMVLAEVVTTSRPQDRANGLILLDAIAFDGELGMSPKQVQGGNMADLYKRFSHPVDGRIIQLPDKE